MNVRDIVEELTQIGIEIRRSLDSSLDRKEQEELILEHIKLFSNKETRIADFQTGNKYFVQFVHSYYEMKHFSKPENKTRGISGGVNIADSNRQICLNDKGNVLLTEEEIREYFQLVECEKVLDQELSSLKNQRTEFRSIQEIMDLLHHYNDIKDVTQVVLGAIAVANRTTVKSLYQQYSLSLDED